MQNPVRIFWEPALLKSVVLCLSLAAGQRNVQPQGFKMTWGLWWCTQPSGVVCWVSSSKGWQWDAARVAAVRTVQSSLVGICQLAKVNPKHGDREQSILC